MEHFVVRLWVAAPSAGTTAGFHGTATHVRSGTEQHFSNEAQLIQFLHRMAERGDVADAQVGATLTVAEVEPPL